MVSCYRASRKRLLVLGYNATLTTAVEAPRQPKKHFDQIQALTRVNNAAYACLACLAQNPDTQVGAGGRVGVCCWVVGWAGRWGGQAFGRRGFYTGTAAMGRRCAGPGGRPLLQRSPCTCPHVLSMSICHPHRLGMFVALTQSPPILG